MFYQVKVPEDDRDFLRFLWWPDGDVKNVPHMYRMTVHVFGAVSSPSCSNFVLRRTVLDNSATFDPYVGNVIRRNMYVDDCLTAKDEESKATELTKDVTSLCSKGGFHMTKWVSNSPGVIESIPEEERAKDLKQWRLTDDIPNERVLGVFWWVENDSFGFQRLLKNHSPTRRGILSAVSSVYDPLGIACPFVLTAKCLLQSLCKQGIGWDECLNHETVQKWGGWLDELQELETLAVARCYKPAEIGTIASCQMHVFADASENGYGVVIYLRLINEFGKIHCVFLLGRSRVAPLKRVTIPRMELTAAVSAVKLSKVVKEELNVHIDETVFWTDSMTVLRYIANVSTRFHTFVANRLAVIHEVTAVEQWRYVNTKVNPADLASRGTDKAAVLQSSQWLMGPDFLWAHESEWPSHDVDSAIPENDVEVKGCVNTVTFEKPNNPLEMLMRHFSDWIKLKKAVGWLFLVIDTLKRRVQKKALTEMNQKSRDNSVEPAMKTRSKTRSQHQSSSTGLSVAVLERAETVIIRYVQRQHFEKEFEQLTSTNQMVKRSSRLSKLDPFIDNNGYLRVGGRLERAEISYDAKHPVILPKESPLSELIIVHIHRSVGHLGKNHILSVLRQKYWILGANGLIKRLLSRCVICRRYQAPQNVQKMANLPIERLVPDKAPFTKVGMDFFGPFEIKRGRTTVKRYGVIFTCLAIRAVHLELACSLDTDSCIDAIRRFIARRGRPEYIRSDNGTNLVGAEREMRQELQNMSSEKIHQFLLQRNITWEFNPPAASHFGGVWERLIRSVRKVLHSLMHEQVVKLDDEGLQTLFCEVEAILNGRPLTELPDSPADLNVLTPNHLLLLRAGESFPPGSFCSTDNYAKRRWRQVQYLADLFWNRWSHEYLPLLQSRQKWLRPKRNMRVGDLVLVVDSSPRNAWNLGRVIEVVQDKQGVVRVVKVKTASAVLMRPVSKLCLILESELE